MREIKFRGKRLDTNEWEYGDLSHGVKYTFEGIEPDVRIVRGIQVFSVDPNTVGQFTGIRDVDGKEIYEGDVMRFGEDDGTPWIVKWDVDRFTLILGGLDFVETTLVDSNSKVVGNIHDNPEYKID